MSDIPYFIPKPWIFPSGKWLILLLLLGCWGGEAVGQERAFRRVSSRDGLPSSNIYWVMQDSKNYLWFATEKGISRYNGNQFENYLTQHGLPDNEIFQIQEDYKGRKWMLTYNGKPGFIYQGKFHNPDNTPWLQEIAGGGLLLSYFCDSKKNIWFSYSNGNKIIKVDSSNTVHLVDYSFLKLGRVDAFWEDPDNGHVCGLASGYGFDFEDKREVFAFNLKRKPYYKRGFQDGEGAFYFSDFNQIYSYKDSLRQIFPEGKINRIIYLNQTGPDSIWVGTEEEGVYRLGWEQDQLEIREQLLKGKKITSVTKDNYQNIWFTSIGEGIFSLSPYNIQSFREENGLSANMVNCLSLDPSGVVWAGHDGGKTSLFNGGFLPPYDFGIRRNRAKTHVITYLSDGTQVIGRDDFTIFRHPERKEVAMKLRTRDILLLDNQKEYLLSTSSLFRLHKDSLGYISTSDKQPLNPVYPVRTRSLCRHSDGTIYIGSDYGLKVTDGTKVWDPQWKHPVLNRSITDIKEGQNGDLWIATYGWGVVLIRRDSVIPFNSSNGLSGDICHRVFIDHEGIVWIASSSGLNKLNPQPGKEGYNLEVFRAEDGLLSSEINDVLRENDSVWIATAEGLNLLQPKKANISHPLPSVYVHEFWVGDSSCLYQANKEFPHFQNRIRIRFDGVSLTGARILNYQYQLLGADESIKKTSNNQVEFSSLAPGEYTFSVWAVDRNGIQSPSPATVTFSISKPWWWSWWFLSLVVVFVLLAIVGAIRYYKDRADRRAAFRIRIAEAEQMALRAQMNPHFIFNALNSIQRYIIRKDTQSAYSYLESFSRLIRKILENSRKPEISIQEEVEWISLYLELEAMRFESAFSYSFELDPLLEKSSLSIPTMLIQPIIENAIWHGIMPKEDLEGSWVKIRLRQEGSNIICIVEDNGIGMERSRELKKESKFKKKSLGMAMTRDRLKLLRSQGDGEGAVQIHDLSPGTRITLKIPVSQKESIQ